MKIRLAAQKLADWPHGRLETCRFHAACARSSNQIARAASAASFIPFKTAPITAPAGYNLALADLLECVGLSRQSLVDSGDEGTVTRHHDEPTQLHDLAGQSLLGIVDGPHARM